VHACEISSRRPVQCKRRARRGAAAGFISRMGVSAGKCSARRVGVSAGKQAFYTPQARRCERRQAEKHFDLKTKANLLARATAHSQVQAQVPPISVVSPSV